MNAPADRARRSGGPRSDKGKIAASHNSLKDGVATNMWLNALEQARYEELLAQLATEYLPEGATMVLLIQRLASVAVKIERLQRVENALYEKAKIMTEHVARQRPPNTVSTYLPDTDEGRSLALRISIDAAMPNPDRLDTLARYHVSLDRQMSRIIGELRHLRAASTESVKLSAPDRKPPHPDAAAVPDISDATLVSGNTV